MAKTADKKRAEISSMLKELGMPVRVASRLLGMDRTAMGYLINTSRIHNLHERMLKLYTETKEAR